jgi:hypothetical protein
MKTVIEMAGQAFETPGTEPAFRNGFWTVTQEELERFAELVCADTRNATLNEIATKIEAMPFGDTAASFAVWIREQKN